MDQRELGKRIRQRREALSMSQAELGKKVGIVGGTISRLESGKSGEPTYETIRNLAAALDTSSAWLIDGDSTDFKMAMSRLESDPVVREALLRISGWFETSSEHDRAVFRRNMETMGKMFARRDTAIRALSSEDVADIGVTSQSA